MRPDWRTRSRPWGWPGFEDTMARFLSQGQRRRVALARLYVSESVALWILDEPFTALDTRGVANLSALIARHLQRRQHRGADHAPGGAGRRGATPARRPRRSAPAVPAEVEDAAC